MFKRNLSPDIAIKLTKGFASGGWKRQVEAGEAEQEVALPIPTATPEGSGEPALRSTSEDQEEEESAALGPA